MEHLNNEKFAFRILVDFHEAFDIGHDIIIQKLIHYGVTGIASNCFLILLNRLKYVCVNGFSSNDEHICCDVP